MEWFCWMRRVGLLVLMIVSGGSLNDSALVKTTLYDENTRRVTHQSIRGSFLPRLTDKALSAPLIIAQHMLLEEEEALIVQHALVRSIKAVQTSIRIMSTIIRISADTTAGVAGGLIKSLGGLFNLLAAVFWQFSIHLHQFRSDSVFLHSSSHRFSKALNGTARVLKVVGESCLWGGEIAEALTSGLGEALQDSFRRLEVLPYSVQQLAKFLLQQRARYIQGGVNSTLGNAATGSDIFRASSTAISGNYTQSEVDEVIRQQNNKYSPNHHHKHSTQRSTNQHRKNRGGNHNVSATGSKSHLPPIPAGKRAAVTESLRPVDLSASSSSAKHPDDVGLEDEDVVGLEREGSGDTSLTWMQASLFAVERAWVGVRVLDASVFAHFAAQVHSPVEAPSMGPHLLLALLLVSIVNLAEYPSVRARVATLLAFVALIWLCVLQVEHSQRLRVVQRTTVKTLHAHLMAKTNSRATHGNAENSSSGRTNASIFAEGPSPFEAAGWVNVAMAAMWNVDQAGGLRAYYSQMYEQLISEELVRVPPSAMVSVRLKRFDLGTSAPMVKGLRVATRRDHECLRHLVATSEAGRAYANHGGRDSSNSSGHYFFGLLQYLSGEKGGAKNRPPWLEIHGDGGGGGNLDDKFSALCDSVALDVDVVFASVGMQIELSLRSGDSRSVLPDVTVSLSEVLLEGQLRAEMRLTPDFPFIGMTNVSFLSAPSLDFTVSSFGGSVELSAIPLAFSWMNASMHAALSQYTAPMYATVDARHIICPSCDLVTLPSAQEVLRDAVRALRERVRGAAKWTQKLLFREAAMVRQSGARVASAYQRGKASVRRLAVRVESTDEFQSLMRATDTLFSRVGLFLIKLRTDFTTGGSNMLNSLWLFNAESSSVRRTGPALRRDSEVKSSTGPAGSEQTVGPPRLMSAVRRVAARALDAAREVVADVTLEDLLHF